MKVYMIADIKGEHIDTPYMATHDIVQAEQWARELVDDPKNNTDRVAILTLDVASSSGLGRLRIAQRGWAEFP